MQQGTTIVDHTTSTPQLAEKIAEKALEQGVYSVDAPVSGGDIGAKAGTLLIMTGGLEQSVENIRPLMMPYSSEIAHVGKPGAGQHTKMTNQIMIANNMVGLCEALLYAQKAGLDHK